MAIEAFPDPLFLAYVGVFALAAAACLASVPRARRIEDPDTRRGLLALLLAAGAWSAAHVGFLLVPAPLATALYLAGLVVGFAAVGAWLYFCSAYTGRSLHRDPTVRKLAVGVFALAAVLTLSNPLHGYYLTAELATTPFPHLAIAHGTLHWLLMGLAYALAVVGYFMLFELFAEVSADTRPLATLAAITALPVLLDVAGAASPNLLEVAYEPLGVAAVAVGVLVLYVDRFEAVTLAGGRDEPVVVLSDADRIRDYNASARALFPALETRASIGRRLEAVLPRVADALDADASILEVDREGETRYYRVTASPFASGRARLGRLVVAADVTERERYRRELERQNERLAEFASVVSHDLRNPVNVASGWIDEARLDDDDERLAKAADALDRMEALIEDLLALARQGRPIAETEPVSLESLAAHSWHLVDTGAATLVVEDDLRFEADADRLRQLLGNLFRNAIEHGRHDATVRVGPLDAGSASPGFFVADDGPGIPPEDRETVFESGYSTAEAGTGFGLSIVAEIVDAHGWAIAATESASGGARFEVSGVAVADEEPPERPAKP